MLPKQNSQSKGCWNKAWRDPSRVVFDRHFQHLVALAWRKEDHIFDCISGMFRWEKHGQVHMFYRFWHYVCSTWTWIFLYGWSLKRMPISKSVFTTVMKMLKTRKPCPNCHMKMLKKAVQWRPHKFHGLPSAFITVWCELTDCRLNVPS